MENPTNDLTKFGVKELREAGELIIAYADNPPDFLCDGVQVWFNMNSGFVFLSDKDLNVAMLNNGKLEQFFTCPICGHEGFKEDMKHGEGNKYCEGYLKEIGIL
jgi:hypothetical protein